MKRIAVLGRGAAGKSTLAKQLSELLTLPIIELDELFWRPGPTPTPPDDWRLTHDQLIGRDYWIIDGDLGDYDTELDQRMSRADTIIILDFPLRVCILRALRRSRETREFWTWLIHYRRDFLPRIAAAAQTGQATAYALETPRAVRTFLADLENSAGPR